MKNKTIARDTNFRRGLNWSEMMKEVREQIDQEDSSSEVANLESVPKEDKEEFFRLPFDEYKARVRQANQELARPSITDDGEKTSKIRGANKPLKDVRLRFFKKGSKIRVVRPPSKDITVKPLRAPWKPTSKKPTR